MKKIFLVIVILLLTAGGVWVGIFYWKNLRGIGPALKSPPQDIAELIGNPPAGKNNTGLPLNLPPGFSIEIFAKDLPGARVMAFDKEGNMWVSRTSKRAITFLRVENNAVTHQNDALMDLHKPHGLAFDPDFPNILYFAEENKISYVAVTSAATPVKKINLPTGGNHTTRTIGFGPDGKLYVSIGSTCNVCQEQDVRRAAIYVMEKDGSNFRQFARGLRNAVFFAWHPKTKKCGQQKWGAT